MTNAQRVNEILAKYGKQIGNHKDLGVHGYIKNRLNRYKKFLSQDDMETLADIMITDLTEMQVLIDHKGNRINAIGEFINIYKENIMLNIYGDEVGYTERVEGVVETNYAMAIPVKGLPCIQAAAKVYGGR